MKCPNCKNQSFSQLGSLEPFAQCNSCGWMVCQDCAGTGAVDTPFSGSDPSCRSCEGEGAFNPNKRKEAWDEVLLEKAVKVLSRCGDEMENPEAGEERIPCTGMLLANRVVIGGCAEPCRWKMQKSGHGIPPFPLKEPTMTVAEAAVIAAAMEWIEAKEGNKYGPNHRQLTRALNQLDEACCDLAAEGEGTWRNPYE